MEITVPHEVYYATEDTVPVGEVIDSLLGTQRAVKELPTLLEECFHGLTVESVALGVQKLDQENSLRELFMLSLVVTFQDQLSSEMPDIIEELSGLSVPDEYDTVITVCLLVLLFYGADYIYRRFRSAPQSVRLRKQLDELISDLAEATGNSEQHINEVLESKYGGNKIRRLAKGAANFFRPPKQQRNAEIRTSGRTIDEDTIAELPGDISNDVIDPDSTSNYLSDVEIEIHAQDVDHSQSGWAAVIPGHVDKQLRMQIFPPVTAAELWTRERVRGDVVVVSNKQDNGELKPTIIHLLRVTE